MKQYAQQRASCCFPLDFSSVAIPRTNLYAHAGQSVRALSVLYCSKSVAVVLAWKIRTLRIKFDTTAALLLHPDFVEGMFVSESRSGQFSLLFLHCRALLQAQHTTWYSIKTHMYIAILIYLIHSLHLFTHQLSHLLGIRLQ